MFKKILKVFGIVFGAVTAFVGSVVGVMALMGKFKTPNVYPTTIQLENEIRIIDKYIQLEDYKKSDLFYFQISGINEDEKYADYEVNKTTCYIWFVDNIGSDLIQLCDENGNALVSENGKYKVECNAPIYYKVVPLLDKNNNQNNMVANLDGKVVLQARHENENVQTKEMTIWIDRQISSVSFNDGDNLVQTNASGKLEQTVLIGTDKETEISYIINPEKSLLPISKENEKIIELYLDDKNDNDTDLVPVTEETITTNETLSKMIKKGDDGKFYFYIDSTINQPLNTNENYEFKIATFPTYQAREEFEAVESNKNLTWYQRIGNMLVTNLVVDVVNSNITEIALGLTDVTFNLYSESDYVTLNDADGVTGANAKNNDLGLIMFMGADETSVRYSEAAFGGYNVKAIDDITKLNFVGFGTDEEIDYATLLNSRTLAQASSMSTITISYNLENYTLVDHFLDVSNKKYYCKDGVIVQQNSTGNFFILKSGVYLDFYVKSGDNYTLSTTADFDYEIDYVTNTYGKKKTWKIASKNLVTNDTIYLGVLAVNNNGYFNQENFFKTAEVTVAEQELSYTLPSNKVTLSVNYVTDQFGVNSIEKESKTFNELIPDVKGSYNALVLAVEESSYNGNVEILWKDNNSNLQYDNGEEITCTFGESPNTKTYYILGYFDGDDFVNTIKLKDDLDNESMNLSLIQFKNGFKQDIYSIITKNSPIATEIHNVYNDVLSVSPQLVLNTEVLNVEYEEEVYQSADCNIELTSSIPGMLANLYEFYSLGVSNGTNYNDYIKSNNNNLLINSIVLTEDDVATTDVNEEKITINCKALAYSDNEITITLAGLGAEDYDIGPIKILSSAPQTIVYKYGSGDNDYVELSKTVESALTANQHIRIDIGGHYFDSSPAYVGFSIRRHIITEEGNEEEFGYLKFTNNPETVPDGYTGTWESTGFIDKDGLKAEYNIDYSLIYNEGLVVLNDNFRDPADPTNSIIVGKSIYSNRQCIDILKVSFAGVDAYIRVETSTDMYEGGSDSGFEFKVDGSTVQPNNPKAQTNNVYKYTINYESEFNLYDFVNINYYEDGNLVYKDVDQVFDFVKGKGETEINNSIKIENLEVLYYGDGKANVDYDFYEYDASDPSKLIKSGSYIWNETDPSKAILRVYIDVDNSYRIGSWHFDRPTNQYVPIKVKFDVVTEMGTLTIELTITSDIQTSFNSNFWHEKTIYKDTTVEVFERASETTPGSGVFDNFNNDSILRVAGTGEDVSVEIYKDGNLKTTLTIDPSDPGSTAHPFTELGEYIFVVYVDGSKVKEFTGFKVVPNIVATGKEGEVVLESDTTDLDLADIFDFGAFESTGTYGKSGYSYYGTEGKLAPTESPSTGDISKLTISSDVKDEKNSPLISSGGGTCSIGWLYNLNTKIDANISLQYVDGTYKYDYKFNNDGVELDYVTVKIENQYGADIDDDIVESLNILKTDEDGNPYYEIKALENYENFVTITGCTLESIKYNGDNVYDSVLQKFSIGIISNEHNATLEFVYTHDVKHKSLTYPMEFKIVPFTPTPITPTLFYTSQTGVDLLNDVINLTATDLPAEVSKIKINGIYLSNVVENTDIVSTEITDSSIDNVYDNLNSATCVIAIKDSIIINGLNLRKQTFYVEYTITYTDNSSYTFRAPITIENRQSITVQYPENDARKIDNISYKFKSGYSKDGALISGLEFNDNGVYSISGKQYEPILIYTNKEVTIDFANDTFKHISRVNITGTGSEEIASITAIAYRNSATFITYFNNIGCEGSVVTLPKATSVGFNGYIIFKITTESGNFEYYYVYVYCSGESNEDASKNVNINSELGNLQTNITNSITTANFGKEYNAENISLYVLSATALGNISEYILTDIDRYSLVDLSTLDGNRGLTDNNNKYITLVLGIMYKDVNASKQYSIGTLTVYITPTNAETPSGVNPLKSGLSTGVYTATIDNNAVSIACPFGGGYTVDENIEQTAGNAEANKKADDTEENGTIKLSRVLDNDYYFVARYKNDASGLVLEVRYTYKATVLPNVSGVVETMGNFTGSGFEKEFLIKKSEKTATNEIKADLTSLLGNYGGGITVSTSVISADGGADYIDDEDLDSDGHYDKFIRFTLTNTEYSVVVTITYTELKDSENNSIIKTFRFTVKPGFEISTTGNDGTNSNSRKTTDLNYVTGTTNINYESPTGSTLTFTKNTGVYTEYSIGGLTIYTDGDSKLEVSLSEEYALNSSSNGMQTTSTSPFEVNSTDYKIYFVHLAETKDLTMYIKILDASENEYDTYNFYIRVAKTYSGFKAIYKTPDADHENVVGGGEATDLYDLLFKQITVSASPAVTSETIFNDYKFKLLDDMYNPVEANFDSMGFKMEHNPNKLLFKVGGNGATLENDDTKIKFEDVTSSTMAEVYIYNQAGISVEMGSAIPATTYKFQVVPGNATTDPEFTDTITYSDEHGFVGDDDKYISYTDFAGKELNVGVLDDKLNTKSFYLINGVTYSFIDADNSGNNKTDETVDQITKVPTNEPYTKTYIISAGGYTLYLKFYGETQQVTAKLDGAVAEGDQIMFKMSLFGTTNKIANEIPTDLQLSFTNILVESPYSSNTDKTIYAGDVFNLINNKINVTTGDHTKVDLELDYNNSSYSVGGDTKEVSSNRTELFKYDSISKEITTYSVGTETVTANLVFNVIYNYIIVDKVAYNFNVNRNLQLVFNDTAFKDATDNPETDFQLNYNTTGSDNTNFSLTYKFTQKTSAKDNNGKYKTLAVNLYSIRNQSTGLATKYETPDLSYSLRYSYDGISISGDEIEFSKDYTGNIEIEVTVNNVSNGSYVVVWNLDVTGVIQLNYSENSSEIIKILNSGTAYNSGTQVPLVAAGNNSGVGVVIARSGVNAVASGPYTTEVPVVVEINGTYVTSSGNSSIRNQELFTNGTSFTISDLSGWTASSINVNIPTVPSCSSDNPQTYYVVYKISFKYLGLTDDNISTFYVAYEVINYSKVDRYNYTYTPTGGTETTISSSTVDLDNGLYGTNLVLFYYYSDGTKTKTKYIDDVNDPKVLSVFDCNFNDATSFNNFIDSIDSIRIYKNATDCYEYDLIPLISIDAYAFGIDLSQPDRTATTKYIENELVGKLAVVCGGVESYTIEAWSESYTDGFKLTTTNKLTATSDEVHTMSSMFMTREVTVDPANYNKEDIMKLRVLGVVNDTMSNPLQAWVNGASDNGEIIGSEIATITVANGTGDTTYKLYAATYSGSSTISDLYKLTETFYVIKTNGSNEKILVRDYSAVSLETTMFSIEFKDELTKQSIDISKAFRIYNNNTNGLTYTTTTDPSEYELVEKTGTNAEDNQIAIDSSYLINYKAENPGEMIYIPLQYAVTVDGMTILVDVEFKLPSELQTNQVTLTIGTPNEVGTPTIKFGTTTGSDAYDYTFKKEKLSDVTSVIIDSSQSTYVQGDSYYNSSTGEISLNADTLEDYFTHNSSETYFKIKFNLTFKDNSTLTFYVVVIKHVPATS